MHIIDGKEIAKKIERRLTRRVLVLKKKGITPKLAVVFLGADKPSQTYIRRKRQAAERIGIAFELHKFEKNISKQDLIKKIISIQKDKKLTGLIVQLPLPESLYSPNVLNAIQPTLDVDCMTDVNLGKLVMKTSSLEPPTPAAVFTILDELGVDVVGKNITIVGMGALVGKPLAIMCANRGASVTTCNSRTKGISDKCRAADIIVTAVGKKNLLRKNMIKKGAIVIDTGIVFEKGKMYGDVAFDEVSKVAKAITPTPGGVGPITVSLLLHNVVRVAEKLFRTEV